MCFYKNSILLLIVLFSFSAFSSEVTRVVYRYDNSDTGYYTRKLIKEYRVIKAIKNEKRNYKADNFSTTERITTMKENSGVNSVNDQRVNINIPLIWYTEKF